MKAMLIQKIAFFIIEIAVLTSYAGQWEVFTSKNDVRDIALSGNTLWAATTGGVVAWNLDDNSYTSYTTADGLISCNISHVSVDKKGRPWVAAKEPGGLFVYENNAWKQIVIGGAENEFSDKIISGLEVDKFGNVWVYAKNEWDWYIEMDNYLWRYDGQTWHKHNDVYGPLALDQKNNLLAVDSLYVHHSSDPDVSTVGFRIVVFNGSEFVSKRRCKVDDRLGYIDIAHIAMDSKGNPWISYYGERSGETHGIVCNTTIYNTLDGLADDNVRSITVDDTGIVWCTTDNGISKFTGDSWATYDTTNGIASNLVYSILISSNNTLYAATSKGISILKANQWKTLKTVNEPLHNNYTDIIVDKSDAVIISGGDHIAIYNGLQWKLNDFENIRVGNSHYEQFSDRSNKKTFIKSEDGTIYAIGNENKKGHILKQEADGSTFVTAFSYSLEKNNQSILSAIACSGNDSCFWLSDNQGNLILFNKQGSTMYPPSEFGAGDRPMITCMQLDRDGRSVWVGYRYDGVVHFDGSTIKKRINESDGLESGWMTAIARDSSGNLWFSSESTYLLSGGVSVLRNTELTTYRLDSAGRDFGFCNELFVDKLGIVWTHTNNGIARFDGSSWKLYDSTTVSPDFPYARYSHIIQDKYGTVWFGTQGSGLLAYADNRWYQFTTRDGLSHNSIRNCVLDSKDNLWILTENGIAMCNSGKMIHSQTRHNFVHPGNKPEIIQRGNRFYVSSNNKPDMIRYTLFDLHGRVIHKGTISNRNSFVLPENHFGSGIRILSIAFEDSDKSQNTYFIKVRDVIK